jgi:hypothetical protein
MKEITTVSDTVTGNRASTATAAVPTESAGRIGKRQGRVSELTVIVPLKPGGADRLRAKLAAAPEARIEASDRIGTVHDMRFVFIDNDTRLLFCTAYDGDWDPYIDDFVNIVPGELDYLFDQTEGWPGLSDAAAAKDFIAKYQVTADSWYCAYPDATVRDIWRSQKIAKALDGLLDASQP